MRMVTYETHWSYLGPALKCKAPLSEFVLDIIYLFEKNGIIPPHHLLNITLKTGGNSGGMGPGTTWTPFEITQAEYQELVDALLRLEVEKAKASHPYISFAKAKVDKSLHTYQTYSEWLSAVKMKYDEIDIAPEHSKYAPFEAQNTRSMIDHLEAANRELIEFALTLPHTVEAFPWGGLERVIKVEKKIFAFISVYSFPKQAPPKLRVGLKFGESREEALLMPFTKVMGYKGWLLSSFAEADTPPVSLLMDWIEESYRMIAPKPLVAQLEIARGML